MTEDTRKDKRAKIVSLNVRYKSATVDEFIENHSHDVSKGGLFIKTPTPFPPGTLIKFEIRIAGDRPVIMGVGRVVWKRDPSQSSGERPSGMGVKFIKIDDSSRTLIDRVVAEKEGAGSAYATESENGPARPVSDRPAKEPPASPGSVRPGEIRKETYIGLGASSPPPKPEPAAAAASPMFPSGPAEPEAPKKEQTVMKQAAELLEEALREAGGSMDDVGTNPLFAEGNKIDPRVGSSSVPRLGADAPSKEKAFDRKATLVGVAPPSNESSKAASGSLKAAPEAAAAKQTISSNPPKAAVSSPPPKTARETPSAKTLAASTPSNRPRASDPARKPSKAADLVEEAPPKRSSGGMFWVATAVLVVAGVAFVYKDNIVGGGSPVPPPSAVTVAPPPTPPPPAPTPTTPDAAPSASAAASASAAPRDAASSAKPAASNPPVTAPAPAPMPTPVTPPPAPKPTPPAPAPAPTPKPAPPPPAPKPTPAAVDTPPAPAPAPKPKPKPKPADDSDNPY